MTDPAAPPVWKYRLAVAAVASVGIAGVLLTLAPQGEDTAAVKPVPAISLGSTAVPALALTAPSNGESCIFDVDAPVPAVVAQKDTIPLDGVEHGSVSAALIGKDGKTSAAKVQPRIRGGRILLAGMAPGQYRVTVADSGTDCRATWAFTTTVR